MKEAKALVWIGWILSGLSIALLTFSGIMKFVKPPELTEGLAKFGWSESQVLPLAIVELGSALLYAWPRTAVLGAILLTGYLGGAVATHMRVGDPYYIPIVLGVAIWLALYLRDRRVRELAPLRRLEP